jgi:predicted transposase YbfD/YdcC
MDRKIIVKKIKINSSIISDNISFTNYNGVIQMSISPAFLKHFSELEDPRVDNFNRRHNLSDILVITILAVICGADCIVDIELFAKCQIDNLKEFLELPNGIPSHDTIGRVLSLLDAQQFQSCFLSWINELVTVSEGEIIAIDGKTTRGSQNRKNGGKALHLISAWSSKNRMVLGQRKVSEKTNEITAIPELIAMLDLKGTVVTIDAMGCQKQIAEAIKNKGADYLLAVKGNQGELHESLIKTFAKAKELNYEAMVYSHSKTVEKDHGRIETRRYVVLPLMYLHEFKLQWKGLVSLIKVESTREIIKGETSYEERYYISSLEYKDPKISLGIRSHWSIENQLHWCLDVAFHEDLCRAREGNIAENLAVVRHIALNLLKKETSKKNGLAGKRKACGWDIKYLAKVLAGAAL